MSIIYRYILFIFVTKVEFLGEDGTYKAENDIPGFSLSDVAPELFD